MSLSSRLLVGTGAMVMAAGAALFAHGGYQAGDAAKVMADLKAALGGDKLAAVTTLTATGNAIKNPNARSLCMRFRETAAWCWIRSFSACQPRGRRPRHAAGCRYPEAAPAARGAPDVAAQSRRVSGPSSRG